VDAEPLEVLSKTRFDQSLTEVVFGEYSPSRGAARAPRSLESLIVEESLQGRGAGGRWVALPSWHRHADRVAWSLRLVTSMRSSIPNSSPAISGSFRRRTPQVNAAPGRDHKAAAPRKATTYRSSVALPSPPRVSLKLKRRRMANPSGDRSSLACTIASTSSLAHLDAQRGKRRTTVAVASHANSRASSGIAQQPN